MSEAENPVQETTWVVLNEEEGSINVTLPLGFGKRLYCILKPACHFVRVYRFARVHGDGLRSPHLLQAEAGGDGDGLGGEQPGLLPPRAEAGVEAELHELHPHRDGRDGLWGTF